MKRILDEVVSWIQARTPARDVTAFLMDKAVPRHRYTFWYLFGGLTLFFLVIQVITGILLSFYYSPSPEHAYESVLTIVNNVPHGWLIRSLHSWSANLMILSLFVHMFSTFLMKAYRKPRELMWLSGTILMLLVLGFAFTGYLLPWDTEAYFATLIGTEIPRSIPLVGEWGVSLLKGGEDLGPETLVRMASIHMIILPIVTLFFVSFHILFNQIYGSSIPVSIHESGTPIPFLPNFFLRDLITWTLGLFALFCLATLAPWGLGDKANPFASAPPGIRPEWYFLPLYETLKLMPSTILGFTGELVVNMAVVLLLLFWIMIPFIDKRSSNGHRSPAFTAIGVCSACYLVGTIITALTLP